MGGGGGAGEEGFWSTTEGFQRGHKFQTFSEVVVIM